MKNITITMEDAVADWVRVEAAKRNASISRLIGEWVGEEMRRQDSYEQAMRAALKFETWAVSPQDASLSAPTPAHAAANNRNTQYDRPADLR